MTSRSVQIAERRLCQALGKPYRPLRERLIDRQVAEQKQEYLRLTVNSRRMDYVARLLSSYVVKVTWLPTVQGAKAQHKERRVQIARVTDCQSFAVALHEIGHLLRGRCPKVRPHYRSSDYLGRGCLKCETDAWRNAIVLARSAGFDWTDAMHAELSMCLDSYRLTIKGWAEAQRELDAMRSTKALQQIRLEHSLVRGDMTHG